MDGSFTTIEPNLFFLNMMQKKIEIETDHTKIEYSIRLVLSHFEMFPIISTLFFNQKKSINLNMLHEYD